MRYIPAEHGVLFIQERVTTSTHPMATDVAHGS
jgi:hypothetical protein